MSLCSKCKKNIAAEYDDDWKVTLHLCAYEPHKLTWVTPRWECEKYEPNLHDNNAARPGPQTRDNGIHQEE